MYDFKHQEDTGVQDKNVLLETLMVDAALHMEQESRTKYLESAGVQALVESGVTKKSTVVRLSKADDYTRRITLAAIQKAKESNSPDWRKLRKAQAMKKMAIAAIVKRYGMAVKRDVIKAQKALLKSDPMHYIRMPKISK